MARQTSRIALVVIIAAAWQLLPAQGLAKAPSPTTPATPQGHELTFVTTMGKIVVRLFSDQAPISSQNLVDYAQSGFYEGTIFHRVINGFMVQGGGFTADFKQKATRPAIKNEADKGLRNTRGTVAMARTPAVDSATAQFFINLKDNPQLDHSPADFGYAVVGKVSAGMEVVDAIARTKTLCPSDGSAACTRPLPPGMRDVPDPAIVIQKVSVGSL